jgi:hypothetical protein
MAINQLVRPRDAQLLRWELASVSAELVGVASGLWLMLGTQAAEFGGGVLFFTCVASFLVRSQRSTSPAAIS